MMMSNVFLMMTRSLASASRIVEVLDEKIDITDEQAEDISVKKGSIEFDHVWFKYKKEAKEYVLSDVSFNIEAGQTIGIIGQTGSAKTTLVSLIPRLYDATKGTVRIDGIDVKKYPMRHLRDAIAVVLQKNTLFSGSLLSNLYWGNENASMGEIDEACHIACVDEFLDRLPQGYDTILTGDGANLSQGQRQLLSIARAAIADPPVLILDEATSSIDTRTEKIVQEGMDRLMNGRTTFVIAHRLSTIKNSDCIMVLEQGRIIERGSHDDLIEEKGRYYQLYTGNKA